MIDWQDSSVKLKSENAISQINNSDNKSLYSNSYLSLQERIQFVEQLGFGVVNFDTSLFKDSLGSGIYTAPFQIIPPPEEPSGTNDLCKQADTIIINPYDTIPCRRYNFSNAIPQTPTRPERPMGDDDPCSYYGPDSWYYIRVLKDTLWAICLKTKQTAPQQAGEFGAFLPPENAATLDDSCALNCIPVRDGGDFIGGFNYKFFKSTVTTCIFKLEQGSIPSLQNPYGFFLVFQSVYPRPLKVEGFTALLVEPDGNPTISSITSNPRVGVVPVGRGQYVIAANQIPDEPFSIQLLSSPLQRNDGRISGYHWESRKGTFDDPNVALPVLYYRDIWNFTDTIVLEVKESFPVIRCEEWRDTIEPTPFDDNAVIGRDTIFVKTVMIDLDYDNVAGCYGDTVDLIPKRFGCVGDSFWVTWSPKENIVNICPYDSSRARIVIRKDMVYYARLECLRRNDNAFMVTKQIRVSVLDPPEPIIFAKRTYLDFDSVLAGVVSDTDTAVFSNMEGFPDRVVLACDNDEISFIDSTEVLNRSILPPKEWEWRFGDGSVMSSSPNNRVVSHIYPRVPLGQPYSTYICTLITNSNLKENCPDDTNLSGNPVFYCVSNNPMVPTDSSYNNRYKPPKPYFCCPDTSFITVKIYNSPEIEKINVVSYNSCQTGANPNSISLDVKLAREPGEPILFRWSWGDEVVGEQWKDITSFSRKSHNYTFIENCLTAFVPKVMVHYQEKSIQHCFDTLSLDTIYMSRCPRVTVSSELKNECWGWVDLTPTVDCTVNYEYNWDIFNDGLFDYKGMNICAVFDDPNKRGTVGTLLQLVDSVGCKCNHQFTIDIPPLEKKVQCCADSGIQNPVNYPACVTVELPRVMVLCDADIKFWHYARPSDTLLKNDILDSVRPGLKTCVRDAFQKARSFSKVYHIINNEEDGFPSVHYIMPYTPIYNPQICGDIVGWDTLPNFAATVELAIDYSSGYKNPVNEKILKMFYLDEEICEWVVIDTSYPDLKNKRVVAPKINELGKTFAILGYTPPKKLLENCANYPNPFGTIARNDNTKISYTLTANAHINIDIFDLTGGQVKTFEFSANHPNGIGAPYGKPHEIDWDGTNENSRVLANGVYVIRIIAERAGKKESCEWLASVSK